MTNADTQRSVAAEMERLREAQPELAGDPRLVTLLEHVVEQYRPLAVYLFGSRAEGRALPTSDYDLLVVLPDDAPVDALDWNRACDLGIRAGVPADVIPTSHQDFLACRHILDTLEAIAFHSGKLIYGA
ncbi:MAG: nucleotidyltransferase domain-containing protein [Deltaproteobacteria bacterium]|nr:nucleotidyltransferase domain-containing protein [Deltaproteobacteria bacterium]